MRGSWGCVGRSGLQGLPGLSGRSRPAQPLGSHTTPRIGCVSGEGKRGPHGGGRTRGVPAPPTVCLCPGPRVRDGHIFGFPSELGFAFGAPPASMCRWLVWEEPEKDQERLRKGPGKEGSISGCRSGRPSSLEALEMPRRCGRGQPRGGGPWCPWAAESRFLHSRAPGLILQPPPARLRGPGDWNRDSAICLPVSPGPQQGQARTCLAGTILCVTASLGCPLS